MKSKAVRRLLSVGSVTVTLAGGSMLQPAITAYAGETPAGAQEKAQESSAKAGADTSDSGQTESAGASRGKTTKITNPDGTVTTHHEHPDDYADAVEAAAKAPAGGTKETKVSEDGKTTTHALHWTDADQTEHTRTVHDTDTSTDPTEQTVTEDGSSVQTDYSEPIYDHTDEKGVKWYRVGERLVKNPTTTITRNSGKSKKATVKETTKKTETHQEQYTETETYTEKEKVQFGTKKEKIKEPISGIYGNDETLAAIKSTLGDYGVTAGEVKVENDFESNVHAGVLFANKDMGTSAHYIYRYQQVPNQADTDGKNSTVEGFRQDMERLQFRQGEDASLTTAFGNTDTSKEMVTSEKFNSDPNDHRYNIQVDADKNGTVDQTVTVSNVSSVTVKDASCKEVGQTLDAVTDLATQLMEKQESAGVTKGTADQNNSSLDVRNAAGQAGGKNGYEVVYATVTAVPTVELDWSNVDQAKLGQDGYWGMSSEEQAEYVTTHQIGKVSYQLAGFTGTDTMKVSMKGNQIIVINVQAGNASEIKLNQFRISADEDGKINEFRSQDQDANTSRYAQQIVFNFGDYQGDLLFEGSLAGTFIAPKANVTVAHTSTGQIVSKSFRNTNGEWHYTGNSAGTRITEKEVPQYEEREVTKTREVTRTRDVTRDIIENKLYYLTWKDADVITHTGGEETTEFIFKPEAELAVIPKPDTPSDQPSEPEHNTPDTPSDQPSQPGNNTPDTPSDQPSKPENNTPDTPSDKPTVPDHPTDSETPKTSDSGNGTGGKTTAGTPVHHSRESQKGNRASAARTATAVKIRKSVQTGDSSRSVYYGALELISVGLAGAGAALLLRRRKRS
ncbi:MAG TPA: hypothetical protein DCF42_04560 [Lachnospiraceae bacterium]|nr:hypothetical protein [Lachnospiraceae bacterium]